LYKTDEYVKAEKFSAINPTSLNNSISYEIPGISSRKIGDYEQVANSYSHSRPCYSNLRVDNISESFFSSISISNSTISQGDFQKLQKIKYKCNDIIEFINIDRNTPLLFQPLVEEFSFSPNDAKMRIFNQNPNAVELKFYDAYDTNWRAYSNGAEVIVKKSEDGFKLISLNSGVSDVHFSLKRHPLYSFYVLAFISCLFTVALLYFSLLHPFKVYATKESDGFV
jgi:hypothetical protein